MAETVRKSRKEELQQWRRPLKHQPVEAGGGRVVEVPVGVGPGQGAHAEPAEILHAPCARHLVTAIQFLGGKPRKGHNRTLLGQVSVHLCPQDSSQ